MWTSRRPRKRTNRATRPTFTVAVTDFQGNPVPAEVSLALVDLAVLSLKEDNAPPIAEAFYSPQPLRSQTGSGLFITGEGLEPEEPLQGGGMGGGGGAEEALASVRLEGEDDGVRQDFKDTAYWEAKLQLDGSGQATVEVPLPDNVTTWRMSSKANAPGHARRPEQHRHPDAAAAAGPTGHARVSSPWVTWSSWAPMSTTTPTSPSRQPYRWPVPASR